MRRSTSLLQMMEITVAHTVQGIQLCGFRIEFLFPVPLADTNCQSGQGVKDGCCQPCGNEVSPGGMGAVCTACPAGSAPNDAKTQCITFGEGSIVALSNAAVHKSKKTDARAWVCSRGVSRWWDDTRVHDMSAVAHFLSEHVTHAWGPQLLTTVWPGRASSTARAGPVKGRCTPLAAKVSSAPSAPRARCPTWAIQRVLILVSSAYLRHDMLLENMISLCTELYRCQRLQHMTLVSSLELPRLASNYSVVSPTPLSLACQLQRPPPKQAVAAPAACAPRTRFPRAPLGKASRAAPTTRTFVRPARLGCIRSAAKGSCVAGAPHCNSQTPTGPAA